MIKLFTLLSILFLVNVVVGQELVSVELQRLKNVVGVTSDQPLQYFIEDTIPETFQLLVTFDNVEKVRLRLKIGEERMLEARILQIEAEQTIDVSTKQRKLIKAQESMIKHKEKLIEANEDKDEIDDVVGLDKASISIQKHLLKLQEVRSKVPEEARQGLDQAIANAQALVNNFQAKLPEDKRKSTEDLEEEAVKEAIRGHEIEVEIEDNKAEVFIAGKIIKVENVIRASLEAENEDEVAIDNVEDLKGINITIPLKKHSSFSIYG